VPPLPACGSYNAPPGAAGSFSVAAAGSFTAPLARALSQEMLYAEDMLAELTTEYTQQTESNAREAEELCQRLRRLREEEHQSLQLWASEVEAARRRGSELRSSLNSRPSQPSQRNLEAMALVVEEGDRKLQWELAALREASENEASEAHELEERLAHAEFQVRRAHHLSAIPLGGGAGAAGGADFMQARERAKVLQVEAVSLRTALMDSEGRCGKLRGQLTSEPTQILAARLRSEAEVQERAQIIQRAFDELTRLHAGLARRCAEYETLRESQAEAEGRSLWKHQARHEERLGALRRRLCAEAAEAARLHEELEEEMRSERAAQDAELMLLASATSGAGAAETELRSLCRELTESERRASGLAQLLGRLGSGGALEMPGLRR